MDIQQRTVSGENKRHPFISVALIRSEGKGKCWYAHGCTAALQGMRAMREAARAAAAVGEGGFCGIAVDLQAPSLWCSTDCGPKLGIQRFCHTAWV